MLNKYVFCPTFASANFVKFCSVFVRTFLTEIALLCKVSRPCVKAIVREIRALIAKECEKVSKMSGEIEIDESYFLLRYARNCK